MQTHKLTFATLQHYGLALDQQLFPQIVVLHRPVLFVMHLLKMRNIISCSAQVLLLCVKSCLPLLHNCLGIDGIAPPIRKKVIGF